MSLQYVEFSLAKSPARIFIIRELGKELFNMKTSHLKENLITSKSFYFETVDVNMVDCGIEVLGDYQYFERNLFRTKTTEKTGFMNEAFVNMPIRIIKEQILPGSKHFKKDGR